MGVYSATEHKLIKVVDLKHRFCVNVLVVEYTITVTSHERSITSIFPLLIQTP
jgi:hypothetical protein